MNKKNAQDFVAKYQYQEAGIVWINNGNEWYGKPYSSKQEKEHILEENAQFKSLREIMDEQKEKEEYKEYLSSIDPVNHPPHYTTGKYEVIDILEDKLSPEEFKGFLKGNILKYVLRAEHKGGMEDYRKAQFYLNKLVGE